MSLIDRVQEKQIRVIFTLVGILAAVTSLSVWYQSRKHKKADDTIRKMELEIKQLELEKLRNQKASKMI